MSRMIIFDDRDFEGVEPGRGTGVDFGPMTDLRATFEIRSGILTTGERLARQWNEDVAAVWVPEGLRDLVASRTDVLVNSVPSDERVFCVNGRWTFPAAQFQISAGQALVEADTGHIIAAELEREQAVYLLEHGRLGDDVQPVEYAGRLLARKAWDVLAGLPRVLEIDVLAFECTAEQPVPPSALKTGEDTITIHADARIAPGVILDNEHGPIAIDAHATIRPGVIICGPAYIGPHSTVLDHALIKANTVIGPVCKVAGEVGGTIFQGFSNKAHDGHLGDSYVGQWVNLGAGTTNSNLLNTYGEIKMRLAPGSPMEATGMMYLGTIFGDHVKTAIGTRLMTGSSLGTGAMIASSTPPPACVAPFAWITDAGTRTYRFNKFVDVARTMMERRGMALHPAEEARLKVLLGAVDA